MATLRQSASTWKLFGRESSLIGVPSYSLQEMDLRGALLGNLVLYLFGSSNSQLPTPLSLL
jgi:hypothetical protein